MDERKVREQRIRERKLKARKLRIRKRKIRMFCSASVFIACTAMLCVVCKAVFFSEDMQTPIKTVEISEVDAVELEHVPKAAGSESVKAHVVKKEPVVSTLDYEGLLDIIKDSSAFPESLVELAERNEEAIGYVYNYPVDADKVWDIELEQEVDTSEVPLLIQWDRRWGYSEYGDGLMGYTGCGPTCLSMVAIHHLDDVSYTPLAVAEFAQDGGYYCEGSGSYWSLMTEGARALGLHSEEFCVSEENMLEVLQDGKSIVAVVGPGDFTDGGHFIVITGHEDGGFTVNDPNSYIRSNELWDYETLIGQINGMWAIW